MSTNQYAYVHYRINSLLMGANCYRVISDENEFGQSLIEEISAPMRQIPGRCYMRARMDGKKEELWMVPFTMGEEKLNVLLDAMEEVIGYQLGHQHLRFPLDVVADGSTKAFLMRPIDQSLHAPIRTYLPIVEAPRWEIASSLFKRVAEMQKMGITSNGISREQLRVGVVDGDVTIWFNETLSLLKQSRNPDTVTKHMGFFSIPKKTEERCDRMNIVIDGGKRDLFSAAAIAFYLIMFTHPFVGSAFYGLMRNEYLNIYQIDPQYIMEVGSDNGPGNQMLSRVVIEQWGATVPELKKLFDGIFLAITHPERMWDNTAPYWNPHEWLRALDADKQAKEKKNAGINFRFENEIYHMV